MSQAVYAINNYVWQLLKTKATPAWSTYTYPSTAPVPVIPSNMEPQLASSSSPYIIYGYSRETTPPVHALKTEVVAWNIYAASAGVVTNTVQFLTHAFERFDESARDINYWLRDTSNPHKAQFTPFNFTYTEVLSTEGPGELTAEGGRIPGLVVVRYQYTQSVNLAQFRL